VIGTGDKACLEPSTCGKPQIYVCLTLVAVHFSACTTSSTIAADFILHDMLYPEEITHRKNTVGNQKVD